MFPNNIRKTKLDYKAKIPIICDDQEEMNEFIKQHKSFIASCAYKTTGRFVTESDDAFQVAMIAFYEAVNKYDAEKGGFLSFASLVIKRRILDDLDRENRHAGEIPADMTEAVEDEYVSDPFSADVREGLGSAAREIYIEEQRKQDIKDEISQLSEILGEYGFSFYDLTKCSPVSRKTKEACAAVIHAVRTDPALYYKMKQTKNLPVKELCHMTGVKRKILERHRKYLIAVSEIMNGEYDRLQDYVGGN